MASPVKSPKSKAEKTCVFCLENTVDDDLFGKLLTKAGITAHYFCMLFASGLSQNGKSEKHGVLGFLPTDIQKEVRRSSRLRCSYCKKSGATIGCVTKNCKKSFHLSCGRRNDTLHQFFDTFCSFCPFHRPVQDVPALKDKNVSCSICMGPVTPAPTIDTLQAPCCKKYWYHRDCIQRYSNSAGLYFFKCPLCNNKDDFQETMLTFGIYIPDQDASWETEPHAFQDLLERYRHCDASSCKCVEGRKYDKEGTKWEIVVCEYCGSQGSHLACDFLVKVRKKNVCPSCYIVDKKVAEEKKMKSPKRSMSPNMPNQADSFSPESGKQAGSGYPGPTYKLKKKGLPQQNKDSSDLAVLSPQNAQRMKMPSKTRTTVETKSRGKRLSMVSPERSANSAKRQKRKSETVTYSMFKQSLNSSSNGENKENAQKVSQRFSDVGNTSSNNSRKEKGRVNSPVKSPVSSGQKRSYKKRLSSDNDKSQTSITHWFKAQPEKSKTLSIDSSPNKTSVIKWFKRNSTHLDNLCSKDLPESVNYQTNKIGGNRTPVKARKSPSKEAIIYSSPPKRRTQIRTVEWKGKQLVIKSPRVMLRKDLNLCKLKPRQLNIDMNDRKGTTSDCDQDLLNIINTDVRLTRNMIQDSAATSTAITSPADVDIGSKSISTQTPIEKPEKSDKPAISYKENIEDMSTSDILKELKKFRKSELKCHRVRRRLLKKTLRERNSENPLELKNENSLNSFETQTISTDKADNEKKNIKQDLPSSTTTSSSNKDVSPKKGNTQLETDMYSDSPSKRSRKCNKDKLLTTGAATLTYSPSVKDRSQDLRDSPAKNLRRRSMVAKLPKHQLDLEQDKQDVDDQSKKDFLLGQRSPISKRICLENENVPVNTGTFSFFKQSSDSPIFSRHEGNSQRSSTRIKAKCVAKIPQAMDVRCSEPDTDPVVTQIKDRDDLHAKTSNTQTDTSSYQNQLDKFKQYMTDYMMGTQQDTKPHQDRLNQLRNYMYPTHARKSLPVDFSKQQNRVSPKTRTQKREALIQKNIGEVSLQGENEQEIVTENPSQPLRRSPRKQGNIDNFTSLKANPNQDRACSQENVDPKNNKDLMPLNSNTDNQQLKHSGVTLSETQINNYVTWSLPGTLQIDSENYQSNIKENVEELINSVKNKTASLDALKPDHETGDKTRRNSSLPLKKRQYLSENMEISAEVDTLIGKNLSMFHSKSDNYSRLNSDGSDTSSNSEVCSTALSLSPSYVTRFRRSHSRTDTQDILPATIQNLSNFPPENSLKAVDKRKGKTDFANDVKAMAHYYMNMSPPIQRDRQSLSSVSSSESNIITIL